MQSGIYSSTPTVNYGAMPAVAAPHAGKPQAMQPLAMGGHSQVRSKGASPPTAPPQGPQQQQSPGNSFQRLKVEDALSYLDMVKFKFNDKPQVYNDFLDIMKEFKSQSIDTPGVIQRVSNLFKGYPELIVGFNTFLPPGYKIEVQRNERGYDYQVSVSVPSPTGALMSDPQHQKPSMILSGSGTIIHSSNMSSSISSMSQSPITPTQQPQQQQQQPPPQPPPQQQQQPQQQQPQQQQPLIISSHVTTTVPPQAPTNTPVMHSSSGYNATSNIHNNSTAAHNALTLSAAQAAVTQALQGGHVETPQNQPVEFNHAINYVNKIKNRFQSQPEKYKRFLEILHTYQKEQRTLKETSQSSSGGGKHLTEQEVYSQVAKLFENQSDLLAEFGQFLPDATSHITPAPLSDHMPSSNVKKTLQTSKSYRDHIPERHLSHKPGHMSVQVKRSPPYPSTIREAPPPKKHKMSSCRDVTLAEAGKYGTLNEYAFFDKVRKALRSQDVYNNFLRLLTLFNNEIVSKSELVQLVMPFLSKFPELMRWFREFVGQHDVEPVSFNSNARPDRPLGAEHVHDVDYSTAERFGASYCVIPPSQKGLTFSGWTDLCHDVLNNELVSFPTWSEDSSFVGSRKNQYEEYMYRCEDERFELDVVIETNASTIRVLEGVAKKLNRMNAEDVAKYRLDDCLGGSSPILHQKALRRIYGEKAQDIIDGLKRNPAVAVPVVLRRLKAKEEEWREAQKGFNKIWREQNEKHYLKSLDYQGINFKQNDTKAFRSKSLFQEIETIFEERNEQNDEGQIDPIVGPHLVCVYRDRSILDDAANLLIHHVKRQTGVQKGEKRRIKHILRQFVPDLFFYPRQQLSDDEREDDDDKEEGNESPNSSSSSKEEVKKKGNSSPGKSPARASGGDTSDTVDIKPEELIDIKEEDIKVPLHAQTTDPDESYTVFMASNSWYLFLRLHAILCERLAKIYDRAVKLAEEERKQKTSRRESTAVALRLKPKPQIEVESYYPAFLDMVKNLLDGNMESNSYEDTLREMFGIHAYIAFTLDKVVSNGVRQLQHCVSERIAITCMEVFQKEQKRGSCGGACATAHRRLHQELMYQHTIERAVQDENCFKLYIYKRDGRMTIEMIDTDTEELKKFEETKKWSTYKENYADCTNVESKPSLPLYLSRNMRKYNKKNSGKRRNSVACNDKNGSGSVGGSGVGEDDNNGGDKRLNSLEEELERKLNQRAPPERDQTEHRDYDVSDETQCRFNAADSKIVYVANKDSFLYKRSALTRAKQSHPSVTKFKANRFRSWCKKWVSVNVSESQSKQCTDWLMGRGEDVVQNRTRVLTNNDLNRTPYAVYNRYKVDRLESLDS